MKQSYDLSALSWTVAGFVPFEWELSRSLETGTMPLAEIPAVPALVPGSVQEALRQAGVIPDWNLGLKARQCEWVENRHWVYETKLPDAWLADGKKFTLNCHGLDYCGSILLNGKIIYHFRNSHVPHLIDLTPYLAPDGNMLHLVFTCPPRWLGQFGRTSEMTEWKPRFNYFWDWTSRLVQIGIWDTLCLEISDACEFGPLDVATDVDLTTRTGSLAIAGMASGAQAQVHIRLFDADKTLIDRTEPADEFSSVGFACAELPVQLWWPNDLGAQPLYQLEVTLLGADGTIHDTVTRRLGFKHIAWQACEGAPAQADPWICVVNGQPFFLQGINWTPIRPNFADLHTKDYQIRLQLYRELHVNLLRVWGGGFLEKSWFYDLCDELGLLVWQEFPLSSSGVDNYPPDDAQSIDELCAIAESYLARRRHHVSLLLWCGGNELRENKVEQNLPVSLAHPLMQRFAALVRTRDPQRRFLTSTPSGPRFGGDPREYGLGVHWAVNGPWQASGRLDEDWTAYWQHDDALLRSETGAPGPSSEALIRKYAGACEPMPATVENQLWRRTPWWVESEQYLAEVGAPPSSLADYVRWGQTRQAEALTIAARACKARFPRCGGIIFWMGHDSFPCAANTALIDFDANPKPAALALAEIFATPVTEGIDTMPPASA